MNSEIPQDKAPDTFPEAWAEQAAELAHPADELSRNLVTARLAAIVGGVKNYFAQGPRHPEDEGKIVNKSGFIAGR